MHFGKYFLVGVCGSGLFIFSSGMGLGGKIILEQFGIIAEDLPNVLHFIFFTLNFNIIGGLISYFLVILWSISVEEQFYIFWGLVMKYLSKHLFKVGLILILSSLFFWYF